jgi:hypothetical protein
MWQEARKQDSDLGLGAQKKTRSAGEELTQVDYSKIESVIINCKFCQMNYPVNWDIKSRTH